MIKEKYIQITNRMLAIISEIEEFKASWKLLDKIQAEKLYGLKKIATIESIASSNRIEGNKLSDDEVEALLSNIKKQSFASRDEQEVMGYAKLMDTIFEDWEVIPLSENYIKQLHKILLQFSTKDEKHKGEYKKVSNAVAAYSTDGKELDIVFQTATPFETPYKMEELVNWTRKNLNDNFFHPLIVIGIFVVEFLAIHPFQDGNGRLSRALTCLLLLKAGYGYIPYSSMESIIEENKESYYRALRKTQTTLSKDSVDYEPWLDFFLKTMQKQKQRLEYKINTFSKTEFSELEEKIISYFENNNKATIAKIVDYTKANRNTVKKALSALINKNSIILHSKGRGAWYSMR